MPTHAERRVLPYTPEQLYGLVADIERYPEFLPWCVGIRLRQRRDNKLKADMMIGFKMLRESFTTEVTFLPPRRIDVAYFDGPFKYLNNHWIFDPVDSASCAIDFFVDFEFRSALLQRAMGVVFNEAVQRMVNAFERRAHEIFGEPKAAAIRS